MQYGNHNLCLEHMNFVMTKFIEMLLITLDFTHLFLYSLQNLFGDLFLY